MSIEEAAREVLDAYLHRFGTGRGLIGPIDESIAELAAALGTPIAPDANLDRYGNRL